MDIKLKQQFEDWESCEKNHFEFCKKNFSPILSKHKHSTTVQSHNKTASSRARKGVFTPLPEKLRYSKVQMICVHYGEYNSKATGKRKSSTFTNSCPAHVTYSASAKFQSLYVSSLNLSHNHDIGPQLYEKYPANRALRQATFEQKAKVKDFVKVRGDNKLILGEVRSETGRYEIPKSLQNFKAKHLKKDQITADSAQRLILQLERDQKDDPEMVVEVSIEPSTNFLEFVFWQSGRMREVYKKYPEHMLCDATFNLNRCGMPLYIIMIVDGNMQSEIVGLCLTKNCKKDYVLKLFETFRKNNDSWKNTRTIMVDRDLSEINVLRELFPQAFIEICLFHVLKAIKSKISNLRMTSAASLAARAHAQKLAYSFRESTFRENVEAMLCDEELANYPEFAKYMQDNWVAIKEMWVHAYRRQHFNLGESTNNRLESYNQKIKGICRRNAALDDFYSDMKVFCAYTEDLNDHEKFVAKTKNRFSSIKFDKAELEDVAREIYEKVVPVFSDTIVQELKKGLSCKSSCNEIENSDSILVQIEKLPDAISNGMNCTCSTFVTKEIPCRHIFIVRKHLGKLLFNEENLPNRLSKSKWMEGLQFKSTDQKRMVFQSRHPSKRNQCKTSQEKYREAAPVLETLRNVLSSCGQETFQRRLKIVNKITSAWAARKYIKILVDEKEFDPDENTEDEDTDDVMDVEEDEETDDAMDAEENDKDGEGEVNVGADEDETSKQSDCDESHDSKEEDLEKVGSDKSNGDKSHDSSEDDQDKVGVDKSICDESLDSKEEDLDKVGSDKSISDKSPDSSTKHEDDKQVFKANLTRKNLERDFTEIEKEKHEHDAIKNLQHTKKPSQNYVKDGFTLPLVKEPLKLSVVGRPKGVFQTVIGLKRSKLSRVKNQVLERSPIRVKSNRHSLSPVKLQNEDYPSNNEVVGENDIWLREPIILTQEHKRSVLTRTFMNCEVIDAAQLLLKSQFKNVTAGLNSVFRVNADFGNPPIPFIQNTVPNEGFFVQIYNMNHHLVSASGFYKDEEANISVYDSLDYVTLEQRLSRLTKIVSLLSAQFKNTLVEKLNIKFIQATVQLEVECGAHAIANALNACLHKEPGCIIYDKENNRMRNHLFQCLEKKELSPFPIRSNNSIGLKVIFERTESLVYCACRKPYTGSKMIQCDRCSEWYHQACVSVSKKHPKKGYEWLCEFKCDPLTINVV